MSGWCARAVGLRPAGAEIVHPGAAAFRFARVPVGVERADVPAARIVHVVEFHLRMPDLDAAGGAFRDAQSEYAARQLEHPGDHALHREIGP